MKLTFTPSGALSVGDKVTASCNLPRMANGSFEWTVTRINKATYSVHAETPIGYLNLYLNKNTGRITR